MMPSNLAIYLETAQSAARHAAAILEDWRTRFSVSEKGRSDLVTEADIASQKALRQFLLGRFPDHAFLGEEGEQTRRPGSGAPPTWIVDPLDGTTNYVHDCPAYCVSIGLEIDGELVVGAVYDPRLDEMFSGARGLGATLNGRPMHTSTVKELRLALISTGFPPDLRGKESQLDWFSYFSMRSQALRRTGSTALNLAYIAAGRFEAYWGFDNHPWDVAGAVVLVREAGGVVTDVVGGKYDHYAGQCLASNGPLHPALVQAFRQNLI